MAMDFGTNNLVLHIKRTVCCSIRIGYQSACDYPIVLGAGILLLLLHRICPPLFSFLVSFSPLFLLTALLLGALLSYGEPCAPVVAEENSQNQQDLSLKSKIFSADCSIEEIESVTAKAHAETRTDSGEVYVEERASEDNMHDNHWEETNVTFLPADVVLSTESSKYAQSYVIVEREEHAEEIREKAELQEFESTKTESGNQLHNQYQLAESMSSCWQSDVRQDPCSDSESDFSESSSPDASMTDIIPMLEELHPLIDLGTGHPSLASGDNLNSSSDDDEDYLEEEDDVTSNEDEDDLEEEDDVTSNEDEDDLEEEEDDDEGKKDDGNNLDDLMGNNSKLDSLMELQRAKNILKFELDQRLMDLQATDATQKLKEASFFRVQVPSISTPREKPFDPSNGSEEVIELPQIPDSAPSVLHQRRNLFDLPSDQIVDHDSQLQGTWTPRSYSPTTQLRKDKNLYGRRFTNPHRNCLKPEKGEDSRKDPHDSHSDSYIEQEGNNGKSLDSLEAHVGEEIKILSAASSDVGVFKVNNVMDEGDKNANFSNDINSIPIMRNVFSTLEAKDSVHEGSEQAIFCCLSKVNNSEQHVVEADSIDEVNSLFKCRMEEVLVQSVSEPSIGQPLTVKLDDELSDPFSSDSGMHAIEASSVEVLNSEFVQLTEEALTCAASDSTCDNELIQEKSSEALPSADEHTSELPIEDESRELLVAGDQQTAYSFELPVLEASSVEEMKTLFKQLEEDVQEQMPQSSEHKLAQDTVGSASDMLALEAESVDIGSAFDQLSTGHNKMNMSQDGEVELELVELNSGLQVKEAKTWDDDGDDDTSNSGFKVIAPKDSAGNSDREFESIGAEGQPAEDI